jgi:hypothetical protein
MITAGDEFTWVRENVKERAHIKQCKIDKLKTIKVRQMFILLLILSLFSIVCPYQLYTILEDVPSWKRYYLAVSTSIVICLLIDMYLFNIIYYKRRYSAWDYVLGTVPFPLFCALCYATTIMGYDGYLIYSLIVSGPSIIACIWMMIYNHKNETKVATIVVVDGKPMIELPMKTADQQHSTRIRL